ncbi:MAG: hypothetical protein GWP91_05090, partial [Rhodobacterales bacterium]|nr:hypothetical protein [Rhodobacterales bacterium]
MPLWFLLSVALAVNPSADHLEREWVALQHLEADTQRYRIIKEPIQIQDGPLQVTLHSGVLVPIFSGYNPNDRDAKSKRRSEAWKQDNLKKDDGQSRGSREFVGFVFTATDATFQVDSQERAQGLVFATHQVRDLNQPESNWTDVAHGAPWQGFAQEGLVLSIDPAIERKFLGPPDGTGFTGDPFDIVVYGEKPRPGALTKAVSVLDERLALMHTVGVLPGRWIAQDRLAESRGLGTSEGSHGVIALKVADPLGQLGLPPTHQPPGVHWMNLLRDEKGSLNPRMRSVLTMLDRNTLGTPILSEFTGEVFDRNDDGVPTAPVRIVGDEAQVVLRVVPRAADLAVVFTADVRLRAVGGDIQWFNLNIPRTGNKRQFKITQVTIPDGTSVIADTPLVQHDRVLKVSAPPTNPGNPGTGEDDGPQPPKPDEFQDDPYLDREESQVTIALPRALKDGEDVVLHLVWQDVWPWTNMFYNDQGGGSLGSGSGVRSILPRPEGSGNGNPWRFTFVAMTPADRGLKFALPGVSGDGFEKEGWRISQSNSDGYSASFADVATSNWRHFDALGTDGRPDLETYFTSATDGIQFIQQFRQISNFYEGYLPTFPWKRQVMFQGRGSLNGFVWTAPHAMAQ